jgi:CHAT domain-containing protein
MERARKLYQSLFGPISGRVLAAKHIIFEPAGGMLKLPPNLLIADDASVARYLRRAAGAEADAFDFRDTAWLGRDRDISTAVSARAFRDIRSAPPSRAKKEYLGLGRNAPVGPMVQLTGGTRSGTARDDCSWGLNLWNNPISDAELVAASAIVGGDKAQVVTGDLFTDAAVKARRDLSDYRVLHFATHGLVAPPQPQCPSEPALLTSFDAGTAGAPSQSDGLLSFREIFDLKLDADLVILSACDTAAEASTQATREVGLAGGGGFALDGLVRAFVGAGGRSVVASHWPAPDDYQATEKLIGSLFTAPKGTSITAALRGGQRTLMDAAETSHPYYWAGFSVIGDGTKPVLATTR